MYNRCEVIFLDLKELLKENNIKQSQLAKKLSISRQSLRYKIKAWEEKRRGFTLDELNEIAEILNKTINFFM